MFQAMNLLTVESRYPHLYCIVQESNVSVGVQTDAIPVSVVLYL